jgi:hypothetical protein
MGELAFGIPGSARLRDHRETDVITADERAEWLIDYILSHPGEERTSLVRRSVGQFLAAEAAAYEKGRREARTR